MLTMGHQLHVKLLTWEFLKHQAYCLSKTSCTECGKKKTSMFAALNAMYASLHSQCELLKVYMLFYHTYIKEKEESKIALGFMLIRQLKSTTWFN